MASDPVEWDRERVHIWIVVGCSKVNRAVGSSAVVVDGVLLQHDAQMSFPGNEHPVGAFGPRGEDPALREGIRSWALGRDLERFDAFAGEYRVEGVGELAVAVADQEAQLVGPLPEISDEIAGQLRRPGRGWMRGNAQDVDVAVAGIQDEEYVDTLEGHAIDVEEIARQKRVCVGAKEAAPGLVAASSRRGRQAVSAQDAADRPGGDPVPQAAQLALDPLISPRRVLGGQSHDLGCQVVADRWPARCSRLAPFAGDQTAMPPQDGAGSDQPAGTQVPGQDPDERS